MNDPAFGNWLAGFIDGEGCFTIKPNSSRVGDPVGYWPRFALSVRDDDTPIMEEIRAATGIGSFSHIAARSDGGRNSQPKIVWDVCSKRDCAALVRLLSSHPLRAKKRRDFRIWADAVRVWAGQRHGQHDPRVAWKLARLSQEIRVVRAYSPLPTTPAGSDVDGQLELL